jgi:hypothetical protein
VRGSIIALALLALSAGCGGADPSNPAPPGMHEALRVRTATTQGPTVDAQFFEGELPAPVSDGPAFDRENTGLNWAEVLQGGSLKIDGAAQATATGVAVKLEKLGSGYWVAPTLTPAYDSNGQPTVQFSVFLDLARDVPSGTYDLALSAVDELGRHGPWFTTTLTVAPIVPQGDLVVSLAWDVNADLDLHVTIPGGKEVSSKQPTTVADPASIDWTKDLPDTIGRLDRDSNKGCVIDSIRTEDFVWPKAPAAGTYEVRVDMFSACSQPAASFTVNVSAMGQVAQTQSGRLLAIDADNGTGPFLYVTQFTVSP